MQPVDIYLDLVQDDLNEGKIWDKVKEVWRDHKGKIIAGTAAVAAAGAAGTYGGKKYSDKKAADKKTKDANQAIATDKANALNRKYKGKRYSKAQINQMNNINLKKAMNPNRRYDAEGNLLK